VAARARAAVLVHLARRRPAAAPGQRGASGGPQGNRQSRPRRRGRRHAGPHRVVPQEHHAINLMGPLPLLPWGREFTACDANAGAWAMLRTGKEHLESLRDGRIVYIGGEKVDDVTRHPAFRGAAATVAALYDMKVDPANRDVMTYEEDGGRHAIYFL